MAWARFGQDMIFSIFGRQDSNEKFKEINAAMQEKYEHVEAENDIRQSDLVRLACQLTSNTHDVEAKLDAKDEDEELVVGMPTYEEEFGRIKPYELQPFIQKNIHIPSYRDELSLTGNLSPDFNIFKVFSR